MRQVVIASDCKENCASRSSMQALRRWQVVYGRLKLNSSAARSNAPHVLR